MPSTLAKKLTNKKFQTQAAALKYMREHPGVYKVIPINNKNKFAYYVMTTAEDRELIDDLIYLDRVKNHLDRKGRPLWAIPCTLYAIEATRHTKIQYWISM